MTYRDTLAKARGPTCPRCHGNLLGDTSAPLYWCFPCGVSYPRENIEDSVTGYAERGEKLVTSQPAARARKGAVRRMNATELRFMRDHLGAFDAVFPQSFTFDFNDTTAYKPDFLVMNNDGSKPRIFEVKGGALGKAAWARDGLTKYRRAKDRWGHLFDFSCWRWADKQWTCIA